MPPAFFLQHFLPRSTVHGLQILSLGLQPEQYKVTKKEDFSLKLDIFSLSPLPLLLGIEEYFSSAAAIILILFLLESFCYRESDSYLLEQLKLEL